MSVSSAKSSPAEEARLDLRHAKVLLADDNNASAAVISQVLVGFGIRLKSQCNCAVEVRYQLAAGDFDLLLIDGEMPDQDGFELARDIRLDVDGGNCTTPIIILSGNPTKGKVLRARDSGANLVIAKPIVPRTLLERIEWVARNPRQFVECANYSGPDRRFHNRAPPEGVIERRGDKLKLLSAPTRLLSQDEINSLF